MFDKDIIKHIREHECTQFISSGTIPVIRAEKTITLNLKCAECGKSMDLKTASTILKSIEKITQKEIRMQ